MAVSGAVRITMRLPAWIWSRATRIRPGQQQRVGPGFAMQHVAGDGHHQPRRFDLDGGKVRGTLLGKFGQRRDYRLPLLAQRALAFGRGLAASFANAFGARRHHLRHMRGLRNPGIGLAVIHRGGVG